MIENLPTKFDLSCVQKFRASQKAKESLRTYNHAWKKYSNWCHLNGFEPFEPPKNSPELLLCLFIADIADKKNLTDASITTYMCGIAHYYRENGFQIDTSHAEIRKIRKGIKRYLGTHQTQKMALTSDTICKIIDRMNSGIISLRDKTLILLGFFGAFRRSEIVGIDLEHVKFTQEGMTIFLYQSKTDQEKKGRYIDIPFAKNPKYCPVRSLNSWLYSSGIMKGAIFRRVFKNGKIGTERLSCKSVALILKSRTEEFGFSKDVAGHSLRSGHVTSAIKNGTPETWIMRQTGHTSINTLRKYERMNREFVANSAANLGI